MIAVLLSVVFAVTVYFAPQAVLPPEEARKFGVVLLLGFLIRMGAAVFLREVPLFSHGASNTADAGFYELASGIVTQIWFGQGYPSFITADEINIPQARNAMLAVNVYALVHYLNGGEMSRMGCVAINALVACMTCLQLVRLGVTIGGSSADSRLVGAAMLFSPGFVFHTADLFKDGISALLVVTAVVSAFRLAERFTISDLCIGVVCLFGTWYVRFYLVFLVSAPLVLSLLGIRSGSAARAVIALAFAFAAAVAIIGLTSAADEALEVGLDTFETATSANARDYNAQGGSGVRFDDSNPWVSFPLRLLYTLFSPFPWQSGSLGFQGGKIDALIWYFFFYRGARAARVMWREDRGTLVMFLVVLIPLTVAYATTMANVGLMLRQRIPIVMLGSVLAVRDRRRQRAIDESAGGSSVSSPFDHGSQAAA
ncbi:hypothetical protein [Sandaracinus amylolyticus]|uniref:Glycosyltransferase RgtA/B/C/D-like domain-containing protein n=1 Tax=Sandaracinus amylolyticus TaxID=927083 RepID=A0A0F6W484_9BACT|nr:hypothetical protein [Sandaracinus amylolyticus]AKF07005.1 hypothetical protein DB32_004154 [Sandaracinus amylolyticus]